MLKEWKLKILINKEEGVNKREVKNCKEIKVRWRKYTYMYIK